MLRENSLYFSIGVALALVGVPSGMYMNFLFSSIEWSPVFMLFSILFIVSYRNIFRFVFPSFDRLYGIIIFFQLVMIIYGLYKDNFLSEYIRYHLYIIVLCISFSTQNTLSSYTTVYGTTFLISGLGSILGAWLSYIGLVSGIESFEMKTENENYAIEAFTVAGGALTNYISCLFLLKIKPKYRILFFIFIVLDIYILFVSGKRTPIFIGILVTMIYIFKENSVDRSSFYRSLKTFLTILICVVFVYGFNDSIHSSIDKFISNFYFGVLNMIGNEEVSDLYGSAIYRYQNREWAIDFINENFNFLNFIFGNGYMTRWIDNPLLQSFLDMGLIGISLYFFIVIAYPLFFLIKGDGLIILFAVSLCIYNVLSALSSGHPYMYIKFVPVVVLIFFVRNQINRRILLYY